MAKAKALTRRVLEDAAAEQERRNATVGKAEGAEEPYLVSDEEVEIVPDCPPPLPVVLVVPKEPKPPSSRRTECRKGSTVL